MDLLDAAFAGLDDADLMESGIYGDALGDLGAWGDRRRARVARRKARRLKRRERRRGRRGARGRPLLGIYFRSRRARGLPKLTKTQLKALRKALRAGRKFARKHKMSRGKVLLTALARVLPASDRDGAALRKRQAGAIISAMWKIAGNTKRKRGLKIMRKAFPGSRGRRKSQATAAHAIDETSAEAQSEDFMEEELPEIYEEDVAEEEGGFDDDSFDDEDLDGILPEALDRYLPQSQNGQLALIAALAAASLMSHKIAKKKQARELIRIGAGAGALLLAWEMWSEQGAASAALPSGIEEEDEAEAAGYYGSLMGW